MPIIASGDSFKQRCSKSPHVRLLTFVCESNGRDVAQFEQTRMCLVSCTRDRQTLHAGIQYSHITVDDDIMI